MKYRIYECSNGKDKWHEVHYKFLWMWLPVESVLFYGSVPEPRMFASKEQAQFWIDCRKPKKESVVLHPSVTRSMVHEHDDQVH